MHRHCHDHLTSHIEKSRHMRGDNTLHVVGVISNPVRYHSRYRLFWEWYEQMLKTPNVQPYIVEIAFGERKHEITDHNNPFHLQLRTKHELWHKEAMINLAVKHLLPHDWRYLCWSDCDVFWADKSWAQETIHQLQHYEVIQPWATCVDMGHHGHGLRMFESFCNVLSQRIPMQTHPHQPYKYAHTGFAWACTRRFWENVDGLMSWCLVGSADHHMAWGMLDKVGYSVHHKMSDGFKQMAQDWAKKAYRVTHGHLGFVKTHIEHKHHGPKARRYYRERWSIFIEHGFDPRRDLMWDEQGLPYVVGKPGLDEEIRRYNRARNEDSIDD